MGKADKPNISKHLLDRAAFIFIRHPGIFYSRADIQNILGISKPTACRIMIELSRTMAIEEKMDGRTVYYSLPEEKADRITRSLEFVAAINDRERLALNFLLSSRGSSDIFGSSVDELSDKLEKAGLLSSDPLAIREKSGVPQKISDWSGSMADTLLTALETKTAIEIDYKGAFSSEVKTHVLWPAGLYIREGNLYLYAYSPKHGDASSYAYSRMFSVSLRYDEHYTIPEDINLDGAIADPFGVAMTEPRRVKVHIYGRQVFYEKEKEWPEDTVITDMEDGSAVFEITIRDPFAFRTWALSLGGDCLVEEPSDIAGWIEAEHENALKRYRGRQK